MMPKSSYSLKQALTARLAAKHGIDPNAAANAGDTGAAIFDNISRASATQGKERNKYVAAAQMALRRLDAKAHTKLINAVEAKLLGLQGRGGDTKVAHVTPGEVVVPRSVLTPELVEMIASEAAKQGIDPGRFVSGGKQASVNPETGTEEFFDPIGTSDMLHRIDFRKDRREPEHVLFSADGNSAPFDAGSPNQGIHSTVPSEASIQAISPVVVERVTTALPPAPITDTINDIKQRLPEGIDEGFPGRQFARSIPTRNGAETRMFPDEQVERDKIDLQGPSPWKHLEVQSDPRNLPDEDLQEYLKELENPSRGPLTILAKQVPLVSNIIEGHEDERRGRATEARNELAWRRYMRFHR